MKKLEQHILKKLEQHILWHIISLPAGRHLTFLDSTPGSLCLTRMCPGHVWVGRQPSSLRRSRACIGCSHGEGHGAQEREK